jgi:hypothetical protein
MHECMHTYTRTYKHTYMHTNMHTYTHYKRTYSTYMSEMCQCFIQLVACNTNAAKLQHAIDYQHTQTRNVAVRIRMCEKGTGAAASVERKRLEPARAIARSDSHAAALPVTLARTLLSYHSSQKHNPDNNTPPAHSQQGCLSRDVETLKRHQYHRVPKFSPNGSVCCACAQRPGLPRASRFG